MSFILYSLLCDYLSPRGKWPKGVKFHKHTGRFESCVSDSGKRRYLGVFDTPEEAHSAYVAAKKQLIIDASEGQTDERIASGLRAHAELLSNDLMTEDL